MFNVKEFAETRGLKTKEVVDVIRSEFRGYDKHLHSKVAHPDKYGVRLIETDEQLVLAAFEKTPLTLHRKETRRKPYRVQCRLSKSVLRRLQQAIKSDGYSTMQDGLTHVIMEYLGRKEVAKVLRATKGLNERTGAE